MKMSMKNPVELESEIDLERAILSNLNAQFIRNFIKSGYGSS